MYHKQRWTQKKIQQRLELIAPLVYIKRKSLPSTQSQPQVYQFIKEDQPALFESIKEQIGAGRWAPIGGMWVESNAVHLDLRPYQIMTLRLKPK